MTYVNKRSRFILEDKDRKLERRRSEGRLKTYPSAEDLRAWCDLVEDRRQHILELVNKGYEKCRKSVVPLDTLLGLGRGVISGDGALQPVIASSKVVAKKPTATVRIKKEGPPGRIVTKVTGLKPGFEVKTVCRDPKRDVRKIQDERPLSARVPSSAGASSSAGVTSDRSTSERPTSRTKSSPASGTESESPDTLRDKLAAKEALHCEQQSLITKLQQDNSDLESRLQQCLNQLEEMKKATNIANPVMANTCNDEIDVLEHEIKIMRKGNLSPEEEANLIKKEVEVLRKYCLKLKAVEDENEKLKMERDNMMQQMQQQPAATASTGTAAAAGGDLADIDKLTKERDELANKVRKLETELLQYKDLPEDLEVYKNRSKMLDDTLAERDQLQRQLERVKDSEVEMEALRQKASRVDELERQARMAKGDVESNLELKKTKSKCSCLEREIQNLQMEKEAMSKRIECMQRELDNLRPAAKEAEMLKLERDKLQIKMNELSHVQVHNENLMLKCKCLEAAANEKDMYKQKYEEILAMECQCDVLKSQAEENKFLFREKDALQKQIKDLETCIHEQEEEIKRLTCHIECMTRSKEETQARMKDALVNMRAEIDKKDQLIAASEEKLICVQSQLKSSIQGVSCETMCYKTRIEELERELAQTKCQMRYMQKAPGMNESVAAIKCELEAAKEENRKLQEIAGKMVRLTGDEHVQRMLKQSECAVKKVVEELSRQYREWDKMRSRNQRGKFGTKQCCDCKQKDMKVSEGEGVENCEKLKQELEDVIKEKKKLEEMVSRITDGKREEEVERLKEENEKLRRLLMEKKDDGGSDG